MGYVTHVVRSYLATNDEETISSTVGVTSGATLISVGAMVATPSSSGNVPDVPSQTARIVWIGPGNVNVQLGQITPSSGRVVAVNVSTGEALWVTLTELRPWE